MRSSLLMLSVVGAAVAGTGCASVRPSAAPREIRVLVYNIRAGKDTRGVDNLPRVVELVRSTNADIALLQELDVGTTRSGNVDQPAVLSRLTGFNIAFGKTLDYQGGDYGIAILSRWPIVEDSLISLPVTPPQARAGGLYEPRGALQALIQAPGGTIEVLNTHIDASREDFYRKQEMTALLGLAALRPSTFVGGDLNAEPGSAVIDMLRGSPLRDAWAECGTGAGLTYPAVKPVKRIDYLLVPAGWRCVSGAVIETEVSDHRPVLFVLRRGR